MVRLFASVFLSLYGDWLTTVALVVVLFELTGTPAGPAGYILARVAPRVLGPSIGGRLSDRWSPRTVMVSSALIQSALIALLIVAHRDHAIWGIYASVALSQFVGAVARPSQGAMLPSLVSAAALPRANATYALFFSSSVFVAPALGAALLTRMGADALFALDGFTFLVSAVLAASLRSGSARTRGETRSRSAAEGSTFRLSEVLRDPVIRLVAVANFTTSAAVTVVQAFLVVAAHDRFGADTAVGYLYAAVGVGGTIGGLIGLRWVPPQRRMAAALAVASLLAVLALGGFPATAGVLAVGLLAISALGTASIDVWGFTQVQRRAPPHQLGRYTSITWMAMYAGMLAGAVVSLTFGTFVAWDRVIEALCLVMVAAIGISWATLRIGAPAPIEQVELTGWVDFAEQRRREAQKSPEEGAPVNLPLRARR